ncbi:acylneuraminate cytidylyltransferase family protein [uncultured Polaribacter sp.]|uniref:acylneuraminate cytidylyltransferase family protein n=1 Tax=uncultured Polaribacter sp. TaxID=174711 RepID=UPI002606BADD|nr:acylneuraminate cytidylyltransferase family protein [uncultured Polaribacter sp.]
MKFLGIIPARGGSKGVKKKNIRLVNNKPLIGYTIEAAQKSKLLTDFLVTTDSDEIIDVIKKYNCNYQRRSSKNAQDKTPIEPVLVEVLENITKQYDGVILLQPTAPARTAEDIDNVIQMFSVDKNVACVVSVVELEDIHPARMYTIDKNMLQPLQKENEKKRRQDLAPVYLRNGCIYAITTKAFLEHKKLILDTKKPYIMPESKWINIDTERDLLVAETLLKHYGY